MSKLSAITVQVAIRMTVPTLVAWHDIARSGDPSGLDDLLADEVVFHSPVVHTPQVGKKITRAYLAAALRVLNNPTFRYVREIASGREAVLEFQVDIDGISLNGVDLIAWNESGKIVDFKVMVRPLKAVNLLHQKMAALLQAQAAEQRMKGISP
jgi:SnoaL-like domain